MSRKTIAIINGPNLNLLGKREPEIYGHVSFEDHFLHLKSQFPNVTLSYFQSNSEGALIDHIQEVGFEGDGIIINAGGYTHTSVAIRDAISAVPSPAIEVHISNIHEREDFRKHSYLTDVCMHMIHGKGLDGYEEAIQILVDHLK